MAARYFAILMYKVKYGICSSYLSKIFDIGDQNTGYNLCSKDFNTQRFSTITLFVVNSHYVLRVWKNLSQESRSQTLLTAFKHFTHKQNLNQCLS